MDFRKIFASMALFGLASTTYAELSVDDYTEAAWITTRFYGAQRSGEGPNWILDGTNFPTSFTTDSYQGKDVSGGWFDCGDHAMFGQPQSWASYILAVSYAEFTEGFYDLYTGDYTDYKASGDYTRAGGKPNKIRDLLEELRYEADFWVKAAPDANTFITVKGNGDQDHKYWVTAGKMSTLSTAEGGSPREITANKDDGYTPGMVAAMMAVMARVDPSADNRAKYLQTAKNAYAYASSHSGVSSAGSYYDGSWWGGRWQDGPFLAALELYRTTNDETYKTAAQSWFSKIQFESGSYTRLGYANAVPLSVVMGNGVFGWNPTSGNQKTVKDFLDNLYANQTNSEGAFTKETGGGGSFSVRTPSGGALLYALYSKFAGIDTYDSKILTNVGYLLGDNSNKKSYVVGYTRNGANAPTAPHHRGYYGNEDTSKDPDSGFNIPEKNKLLGGTIAGDFTSGSHNTTVSSWNVNEVCVDLNAPLVGALGYILSKKKPVTDDELGVKIEPEAVKPVATAAPATISMEQHGMQVVVSGLSSVPMLVELFDLQGHRVSMVKGLSQVSVQLPSKGVFLVKVSGKGVQKSYKVKAL
ncbi:glycoside hydrolase family 9 protein [Fibrobacter sp.]|uniref:glycoside hydrolase family 9 protein n=1 Tax=Fibrobacter sp. TaxID=35828 RepID=UPI00388E8706